MANKRLPLKAAEKLFPYISANPYVTIMMTGFLGIALYVGKSGTIGGAANPFTTFGLGWFFLSQIAFVGIESPEGIAQAIGVKTPVKGLNIILAVMGIGVGLMSYSVAQQAATIVPQNTMTASILNPLYNPYNSFPARFSIITTFTDFFEVIIYNFGVVGAFEEFYKIIIIKNIANYLYAVRGWPSKRSVFTAMFVGFSVWSSWHWIAAPDWTAGIPSLVSGIGMGILFYSAWIIADFLGALSKAGSVVLASMLVIPSITTHGTWNSLQSLGGTGLPHGAEFIAGLTLFLSGLISLYLIRGRFQIMHPGDLR